MHSTLLEEWSGNERLRHIPSREWLVRKLDVDLRRRIEGLHAAFAAAPHEHPVREPLEVEFRALCRALERVCEIPRRFRGGLHPPADPGSRLSWTISQAVNSLSSLGPETFGRRYPFQTFERSNAEPLWGAMLSVIDRVRRILDLVRQIDPGIDELMLEDLVELREPMRSEPIA